MKSTAKQITKDVPEENTTETTIEFIWEMVGKLVASSAYWIIVSVAFGYASFIAKAFGYAEKLDTKSLWQIIKFFDSRLYLGMLLACLVVYLIVHLGSKILHRIKPDPKRNLPSYFHDEIFSQLIGMGSVANSILLMKFFVEHVTKLPPTGFDVVNWWIGLTCWSLAISLRWIKVI